jgi:hypothetical protein
LLVWFITWFITWLLFLMPLDCNQFKFSILWVSRRSDALKGGFWLGGFVLVLNAWGLKSKKKPKTWFFCKKKIRGDFER